MVFFQQLKKFTPPLIYLMGGPGSGKSVLAQNLPELQHLSIGELMRSLALGNDPRSVEMRRCMESGQLLDDQIIFEALKTASQTKQHTPLLLDGFPRTFSQWAMLQNTRNTPSAIIDLRVPKSTMRDRLFKRQRSDDTPDTIERRIKDYSDNTRPLADIIIASYPLQSCSIELDTLSPEELAEKIQCFLRSLNLYPTEIHPAISIGT